MGLKVHSVLATLQTRPPKLDFEPTTVKRPTMYMCVCVYVCVYVYMCICVWYVFGMCLVCVCMRVYVFVCVCMCLCMFVCMCVYVPGYQHFRSFGSSRRFYTVCSYVFSFEPHCIFFKFLLLLGNVDKEPEHDFLNAIVQQLTTVLFEMMLQQLFLLLMCLLLFLFVG